MILLQKKLKRTSSFSGFTTMVRFVMMFYINLDTFFESPNEDLKNMLLEMVESPPWEGVSFSVMDLSNIKR